MRRIALLTNPHAGGGRGARAREVALPRLRRAGCEVVDLIGADGDDARRLAARAAPESDAIVACGGDGTVHLAAQAAVASATTLGVIAAGTGNDLARELALPRDPAAATDRVIAARTRTIDLARIGSSFVTTVVACGFDALVAERADAMTWPRGPSRYVMALGIELRRLTPRRYTLSLDGREHGVDAVLVAVANTSTFGGGMRIAPDAEVDDGLLEVVVVRDVTRRTLVRAFPRIYRGTHVTHPAYEHHRVRSVTLAAPGITAYADGDPVGPLPLSVAIAPRALEVIV